MRLTAAPRGQRLEVTVENPARGSFSGKLEVRAGGRTSHGPAVQIGAGQGEFKASVPLLAGLHQIVLTDGNGSLVARTTTTRYECMNDFPTGPGLMTSSMPFSTRSRPGHPGVEVPAAGTNGPASLAVEVAYQFDPGMRILAGEFPPAADHSGR